MVIKMDSSSALAGIDVVVHAATRVYIMHDTEVYPLTSFVQLTWKAR